MFFQEPPPEPPVSYCFEEEDNCIGSYIQSEDGTVYRIIDSEQQDPVDEYQQVRVAELSENTWVALAIPDEIGEFVAMHTLWCIQAPDAPSCG